MSLSRFLPLLRRASVLGLAAALLATPACQKAAPDPTTATPAPAATVLTGSTLIGEYSAATLASRAQGVPLAAALVNYPIKVYRLTYRTRTPAGQETTASGAVLVPVARMRLSVSIISNVISSSQYTLVLFS